MAKQYTTEEMAEVAEALKNMRDSALRAANTPHQFKLTVEDTFTLSKARVMVLLLRDIKYYEGKAEEGKKDE